MKSPPRPQAIGELLEEIKELAGTLGPDYEEAYDFSYLSSGWRPESAGKISKVSDSNPTLNAVVDGGKERLRRETLLAYRHISAALHKLTEAADALQRATPRESDPEEVKLFPRTITREELAESKAKAQAREEASNEMAKPQTLVVEPGEPGERRIRFIAHDGTLVREHLFEGTEGLTVAVPRRAHHYTLGWKEVDDRSPS